MEEVKLSKIHHRKNDSQKFRKWLQQKKLSINTVNTYVEVTTY